MRWLVVAWLCAVSVAHAEGPSLYSRGVQAFADGDFDNAAKLFEEAHKQSGNPAILFDLAQSHRRLFERDGDKARAQRAIDCYQRYLASGRGDDSSRKAATSEMEHLQKRLKALDPPPPAPKRNTRPLGIAALAVGFTGLGLTIAGAATLGSITDAYNTLDVECRRRPCDASDYGYLRDRIPVGGALLGVGLGLVVVDFALIGLWNKERTRPVVTARLGF